MDSSARQHKHCAAQPLNGLGTGGCGVASLSARRREPPAHLSPESREFWRETVGEDGFDAAGLRLLKLLAEALDPPRRRG